MDSPEALLTEHRQIPLEQLVVSPTSSQAHRRKTFDKAAIAELATSLKQTGLVQAIVVRPLPIVDPRTPAGAGRYEIVAGERRFLAAKHAGLERIDCAVRYLGDEQVLEVQLIENLQREDLHPMHEAESYDELQHRYGHDPEEIYGKVSKSKTYFYNRLKLLALSPACRKAFYAKEISTSIAEKIARIPVHSLQDEALEAVLGFPHAKETYRRTEPLSYRRAVDYINEHFMLDLSTAPFPIDDEKLNGAVACMKCPKMAGNQPELFADVKKGNTCTDTVCFQAKARAYGQRRIAEAKAAGEQVLVGPAAKKAAPNGVDRGYDIRDGYHLADEKRWTGSQNIEPRKVLKPGEKPMLLQDPKSGRVVEVVHDSQMKKHAPSSEPASNARWERDRRNQAARAKVESAVRRAVFAALVAKGKWKAPPLRTLAELAAETMDFDGGEALMDALGVPEPKKNYHDRISNYVKALKTEAQIETFLAQAYLAEELHVSSYSVSPKFPRLEAAAKAARVDVAAIRKELTPKKKKKAKAARKHK